MLFPSTATTLASLTVRLIRPGSVHATLLLIRYLAYSAAIATVAMHVTVFLVAMAAGLDVVMLDVLVVLTAVVIEVTMPVVVILAVYVGFTAPEIVIVLMAVMMAAILSCTSILLATILVPNVLILLLAATLQSIVML